MPPFMLELRSLHYHPATAQEPVLRGLDLQLHVGQPALVAGRSGSGKSTLLELICGLAEPSGSRRSASGGGSIRWNAQVLNARQRRWLCGLLFQFPERHFLGLSVGQELKLGQRRVPSERIEAVLHQVGLDGISLQQAPEALSGGQQRRLALAVQLLRNPKVLLLDEPTAGLDWSVRGEILSLLAELGRERVLLVVTHEPDLFNAWVAPEQRYRLQAGVLQPLEHARR
jgi:energy-coupling factor transport system ATP-binding protein